MKNLPLLVSQGVQVIASGCCVACVDTSHRTHNNTRAADGHSPDLWRSKQVWVKAKETKTHINDNAHHICRAVLPRTRLRFGYGKMHFYADTHGARCPTSARDGGEDTSLPTKSPLR